MSVGNVKDIGEILASIEALKEQADHSHEMQEHQNSTINSGGDESEIRRLADSLKPIKVQISQTEIDKFSSPNKSEK